MLHLTPYPYFTKKHDFESHQVRLSSVSSDLLYADVGRAVGPDAVKASTEKKPLS